MKSIVCLIRRAPPLVYFVNRIHEVHPVSLVVVEAPKPTPSLRSRLTKRSPVEIVRGLQQRLARRSGEARERQTYDSLFGDRWGKLSAEIPVLETDSINSDEVREALVEQAPSIVLDHGTSIVRDHILEHADVALNLHWGLSPYYRGTRCTDWALIGWDPYHIGVTIHKLTNIVDGGDVAAQARATIRPDDTPHSINMQLTRLGTELIVQLLSKIQAGEELAYHCQDHTVGIETRNRQFSPYLQAHVSRLISNGSIARMLKRPARKEQLPIVEIRSGSDG